MTPPSIPSYLQHCSPETRAFLDESSDELLISILEDWGVSLSRNVLGNPSRNNLERRIGHLLAFSQRTHDIEERFETPYSSPQDFRGYEGDWAVVSGSGDVNTSSENTTTEDPLTSFFSECIPTTELEFDDVNTPLTIHRPLESSIRLKVSVTLLNMVAAMEQDGTEFFVLSDEHQPSSRIAIHVVSVKTARGSDVPVIFALFCHEVYRDEPETSSLLEAWADTLGSEGKDVRRIPCTADAQQVVLRVLHHNSTLLPGNYTDAIDGCRRSSELDFSHSFIVPLYPLNNSPAVKNALGVSYTTLPEQPSSGTKVSLEVTDLDMSPVVLGMVIAEWYKPDSLHDRSIISPAHNYFHKLGVNKPHEHTTLDDTYRSWSISRSLYDGKVFIVKIQKRSVMKGMVGTQSWSYRMRDEGKTFDLYAYPWCEIPGWESDNRGAFRVVEEVMQRSGGRRGHNGRMYAYAMFERKGGMLTVYMDPLPEQDLKW